jgi:hypothetical protein
MGGQELYVEDSKNQVPGRVIERGRIVLAEDCVGT